MSRLSLDDYYLKMLALVAARSTCARRAVGAILVDARGRVLGTGYNGVPRGMVHCTEVPCAGAGDPSGDTSRCFAVHAEVNAIVNAHRLDLAHTLYVSCTPCGECAKVVVNAGIKLVVSASSYSDVRGEATLRLAGVRLEVL